MTVYRIEGECNAGCLSGNSGPVDRNIWIKIVHMLYQRTTFNLHTLTNRPILQRVKGNYFHRISRKRYSAMTLGSIPSCHPRLYYCTSSYS
jgi:hypothetical protein